MIIPTLRGMPNGLVGCGECWMRSARERRPYDPPCLFENIEEPIDHDGHEYELRGSPGAYERRLWSPVRPGSWEPPAKPRVLCCRCQDTTGEVLVYDLDTGNYVQEQSSKRYE